MLSLIGISCITSLSGTTTRGQIKGFAMGLFGLLISTIGQERQSGSLRFDLGMMYLWDGLDFVPVLVGIFAIPEIIDLAVRGTSIAGDRPPENLSSGVMEGVNLTVTNVATGIKRDTTSNAEGYYTVSLLLPGPYRINVQAAGFRPISRSAAWLAKVCSKEVSPGVNDRFCVAWMNIKPMRSFWATKGTWRAA